MTILLQLYLIQISMSVKWIHTHVVQMQTVSTPTGILSASVLRVLKEMASFAKVRKPSNDIIWAKIFTTPVCTQFHDLFHSGCGR